MAGSKIIVFTSFTEGLTRHAQTFGTSAVTMSGEKTVEKRMAAVDRFQVDDSVRVAICNLIAGGVSLNFTAAMHLILRDLDWVPANHLQAEDRAYRRGLGPDGVVTEWTDHAGRFRAYGRITLGKCGGVGRI